MKLSVIVPSVDGVVPESLPAQDDVEVIVVKGVSPVSEARNEGLARATGDYIAWVDADDDIEADWLPDILSAIKDSPDVISFNAAVEWVGSTRNGYIVGGEANAADVMAERATGQLWNKVIRRKLFDGLLFHGVVHEDYRLLCELLPRARIIKHIDKVLYRYRRSENGLSQHLNAEDEIRSLKELICISEALPSKWHSEMSKGVSQRIADFCRNAKSAPEFRCYIRKNLPSIWLDDRLSLRVKVKALLAGLGG